jgi:LacI family transcriptional regulator
LSAEDRSATLAEVAQRAEVSLATASRALNGSTRQVTQVLRERVLAAAKELHYTPHGPAQAVARGTSQFVALVVGDIADPYFSSIAAGLSREADRRGLTVAIAPTGADAEREVAVIAALRSQRLRAVVLAPSRTKNADFSARAQDLMTQMARAGAGVGYLGGETSPAPDAPLRMLRVSGRTASGDLARALVDIGYRSFAVLTGPPELATPAERAEGFAAALREAGVDEPLMISGPLSRAGGHRATRRLLADGPRPQCVFAVTDMMAVGAMAALREHGLDPGVDLAVAGFDDLELLQDLRPSLTTVALPLSTIGESLLRLALDGEDPGTVLGEVRLRESTPGFAR